MFDNTEEEDLEMVRTVACAIEREMVKQAKQSLGSQLRMDRIAIAAVMAMVRWARSHPPTAAEIGRH